MAMSLGGTEVVDLASEAVGDTFRVFVAECGPRPVGVLYVTDGNGLFGLATDTVRLLQIPALVPSLLVIGIGYPDVVGVADTVEVRVRDLTPTVARHSAASGGADAFLRFIEDELQPWVRARYGPIPTSLSFGHSLGGLFATYALLDAPSVFDHHIISSPSLWWDDEAIFGIERQRDPQVSLECGAFFGIGSLETDHGRRLEGRNLPEGHPAKPPPAHLDMVADMRRFVAQLSERGDPTLDLVSAEIEGEFHATVPGVVLTRGLRHAFPGS